MSNSNDGNKAGASGQDNESINFNSHDIIILSVVVGVVVVIAVASTILYFVAKKRQWQVRASIHRVTQALKSPLTPTFPKQTRIPEPQSTTRKNKTARSEQNREPSTPSGKGGNHRVDAKIDARLKMDIDPEKGFVQ